MQNTTIPLGFVKAIDKKYRFAYLIGIIALLLFVYYINNLQQDGYGIWFVVLQIPFVIIVSLPSLFPEKELFQLFLKFTDSQIRYRTNYLKGALIIDYSKIDSIEIKATRILINTEEKLIEVSFNTTSYKRTQKIKASFDELKKELNI